MPGGLQYFTPPLAVLVSACAVLHLHSNRFIPRIAYHWNGDGYFGY